MPNISLCSHSQAPVLENVQDVTISADGTLALVSYEDKVSIRRNITPIYLTLVSRRIRRSGVLIWSKEKVAYNCNTLI